MGFSFMIPMYILQLGFLLCCCALFVFKCYKRHKSRHLINQQIYQGQPPTSMIGPSQGYQYPISTDQTPVVFQEPAIGQIYMGPSCPSVAVPIPLPPTEQHYPNMTYPAPPPQQIPVADTSVASDISSNKRKGRKRKHKSKGILHRLRPHHHHHPTRHLPQHHFQHHPHKHHPHPHHTIHKPKSKPRRSRKR